MINVITLWSVAPDVILGEYFWLKRNFYYYSEKVSYKALIGKGFYEILFSEVLDLSCIKADFLN